MQLAAPLTTVPWVIVAHCLIGVHFSVYSLPCLLHNARSQPGNNCQNTGPRIFSVAVLTKSHEDLFLSIPKMLSPAHARIASKIKTLMHETPPDCLPPVILPVAVILLPPPPTVPYTTRIPGATLNPPMAGGCYPYESLAHDSG